ncbi:DUF805 domain-containing protein [Enterococcus termitis]|uniref:DUF805 domain-containing protein n=1 Tax=Enterococcus termitis TaxID=332950 RepID=A0A1E5GCM4_9ENTE|nr:DUF805 domain-containing protein [Enterococcus termitis]OEG10463.1 hypothetical protein BCR25_08265 [Enterococcus termitis]OJG97444.1 hypothetical protein RV18_GL000725 [Enterococcus termitis]
MEEMSEKQEKVSFLQAIKNFWVGYIDFKGRTTRTEFWVNMLLFLVAIIGFFIIVWMKIEKAGYLTFEDYYSSMGTFFFLGIFLVIPYLAMFARRMRDAGFNGKGTKITVRGNIVEGKVKIGTAFIP